MGKVSVFLQPPREPAARIKDVNPSPEMDFLRLRPVLVKAGDLLKSGATFLSDAWGRLPQVKVELWHRGLDLEADLKRLLSRHTGTDRELGSFLLRCGRWALEIRLLHIETDADTDPELLDWDPFLMDLQNMLNNHPEDKPPDNRILADAILILAEKTGAGLKTLSEGQARMEGRLDGMDGRLDGMDGRLDRIDGRLDGIDESLKTLTKDVGDLKGDVAVRVTRTQCFDLAEDLLDLDAVKILNRTDLRVLLKPLFPTLARGVKESFCEADLVMECEHRSDGARAYVAVEASFTGDKRDSDRALRNADLLTQCTGVKAHAVVSSVQNDYAVQALVDSGDILWYRLSRKALKPD